MSRVIALVEPVWGGHSETQLQIFIQLIVKKWGWRLIVLAPKPEKLKQWLAETIPEVQTRVFITEYTFLWEKGAFTRARLNNWYIVNQRLTASEIITGWKIDLVFITWIDYFSNRNWRKISDLLPRAWVALYIGTDHYQPGQTLLWWERMHKKSRDYQLFKSPFFKALAILDEGLLPLIQRRTHGKLVYCLPDVTDESLPLQSSPAIREIRRRAAGRPIIGLLGVLEPRKGVITFLRLIERIDPSQCFFILIGRLMKEMFGNEQQKLERLLQLHGARENCRFLIERIEDPRQFNEFVDLCDGLFLAYQNFGNSSGLLTKAAVFKTLVIVSSKFCIGERARYYKMGLLIQPNHLKRAVATVNQICNPEKRKTMLEGARFEEYHHIHNIENLDVELKKLLGANERILGKETELKNTP